MTFPTSLTRRSTKALSLATNSFRARTSYIVLAPGRGVSQSRRRSEPATPGRFRENGLRKMRCRRWSFALASVLSLAPAPAHAQSAEVVPPRRLDATPVPYPPEGHGDASVTLVLVVDSAGEVKDALVREGAPPFSDAAVAAVKNWRFAAATRDGSPVAARIVAAVNFRAPPPEPAVSPPPRALPGTSAPPPAA